MTAELIGLLFGLGMGGLMYLKTVLEARFYDPEVEKVSDDRMDRDAVSDLGIESLEHLNFGGEDFN